MVEDLEAEILEMGRAPELVPEPYLAALEGDWERIKRFYEQNREALFYPLTTIHESENKDMTGLLGWRAGGKISCGPFTRVDGAHGMTLSNPSQI
ncbi:hypothetical protein FEM48_Zijuj11G0141800 [Ziziphus jujuba var. spinosa]|uniref:Uncharacterized protein n=1 Tax=Ziziphus jujuba var. spinosa TaxID=714518 RepID=A0A978UJE3_ZIZJJ|nr:hypothetical protein FEM48_Zijuj11G0141800 [Ziziphus jujuba var. spinosa]